jgi:hypothetical protein
MNANEVSSWVCEPCRYRKRAPAGIFAGLVRKAAANRPHLHVSQGMQGCKISRPLCQTTWEASNSEYQLLQSIDPAKTFCVGAGASGERNNPHTKTIPLAARCTTTNLKFLKFGSQMEKGPLSLGSKF